MSNTKIAVLLILFIICSPSYGQKLEIVANYGECLEPTNTNITTPSSVEGFSQFEIIENLGDGFYRFKLSGGLPRFADNSADICIDNQTAIGFKGIPSEENGLLLPFRVFSIDSTGYFDGKTLVIMVNSIFTDLSGSANFTNNFVQTSAIIPVSHTLFFELDERFSPNYWFILKKMVRSSGFISANAASVPSDTYLEGVDPSLGAPPRILTPPESRATIHYFFRE